VIDRYESRTALLHLTSEADQDRAIDAFAQLDASTAGEEGRQTAEQVLTAGQSPLVALVSLTSVADAMRTSSFR